MIGLEPLTKDQVRACLHFKSPPRPAKAMLLWHNEDTIRCYGDKFQKLLETHPDDVIKAGMVIQYWQPPEDDPQYCFAFNGKKNIPGAAVDANPLIESWDELGDFLDQFPTPHRPDAVSRIVEARKNHPDRYILSGWGHFFHQRLAYLRGIENLLYDFHDNIHELRVVMDRLLEFYEIWAQRSAGAGCDGVWAGDDLGMQNSLFMSPSLFRELYKPYYKKLADILHSNGLDMWLHTCGNITEIMPDIIESGVDAVHPIQCGTMDDNETAEKYAGKIAFWIGMDVQNLIPFGTPPEIEKGVFNRAKTFYRHDGGLIIAAGNAILPNIDFENILTYARTVDKFCMQCRQF